MPGTPLLQGLCIYGVSLSKVDELSRGSHGVHSHPLVGVSLCSHIPRQGCSASPSTLYKTSPCSPVLLSIHPDRLFFFTVHCMEANPSHLCLNAATTMAHTKVNVRHGLHILGFQKIVAQLHQEYAEASERFERNTASL